MKENNLLLIWDRIGDYHLARVKACEEIVHGTVYTADLAGSDTLYKWDSIDSSRHTVLSDKPAEESDIKNRFKAFRKLIHAKKITAVAMPYGRAEYHIFLLYARCCGIRTIIFSESWYPRGAVKDFGKALLLKILGTYYFVSGKRAYNHFANTYKIPADKIKSGYSVVDNNHFQRRVFAEKKYIVCMARYSEEKNLSFLIHSYAKSSISKKYRLMLVGEGPLRDKLQSEIQASGLNDHIELTGWLKYADLPKAYAAAALFILPSRFEPWGLVVNEAMAAGLPVMLSDTCGCAPDLLLEGINGWTFSIADENALIERFNTFEALSEKAIELLGKNSIQLVQTFSPQTWATTIECFLLH